MVAQGQKRITLAAVILRVRFLAENRYDGKIYDYILPIFNQLSTMEKRILLRGLIGMCSVVEDTILEKNADLRQDFQDATAPVTTIQDSAFAESQLSESDVKSKLELENGKALIGLKSWAVKSGAALLILILLLAVFGSFFVGGESPIISYIANAVKIYKVVMGSGE